jgi:glycosyltransferase involved in cell wall biosynthesis
VPGDSLEAYRKKGISGWLEEYYNPCRFFREVFLFSPLEKTEEFSFGMTVVPTSRREFAGRLVDYDIDVVRAYGGHWPCDIACREKNETVPVIVSVHDSDPRMLHRSVRMADAVFCVSSIVRELVIRVRGKPESTWILPNRVNMAVMRPVPSSDYSELDARYPSRYKILHIGRRTEDKNLDTLMSAVAHLGPDYHVVTIGRGDIGQYRRLARRLDIEERVHFIDAVPNSELPRYYSWADCFCTPSRREGFGLVFIEALACEAVVVTSDIRPMNEYIEHMRNGLLVKDYENPGAVAEGIRIACSDDQLRANIKGIARSTVAQFDKPTVDRLEASLYGRVLSAWGR